MIMSRLCNLCIVLFIYTIVLILFGGPVSDHALHAHLAAPECPDGSVNAKSLFAVDCWGNRPVSFGRLRRGWLVVTVIFAILWVMALMGLVRRLPSLFRINQFYAEALSVSDVTQHSWAEIVRRLVAAQQAHQFFRMEPDVITITTTAEAVPEFDALFVANCLTRKDNFYIALYTHDIVDTRLFGVHFLPHSLHWCIDRCISATLFQKTDMMDSLERDKMRADALISMYRTIGVLALIAAPGILVYRLAMFVFRYADDLRSRPQTMTARHWSNMAMFRLRDYCEVPALLHHRLALSYKPAAEYATMFPSPMAAISARFMTIVTGGIIAVLLLGSLVYDEQFLKANLVAHRSVSWWLAMVVLAAMAFRSLIPNDYTAFQPAEKLREVAQHVHHYPPEWRNQADSKATRDSFCRLFPYRIVSVLEELASVVLTPLILIAVLPKSALATARFINAHSTFVPIIGHVCNMAMFDRDNLYRDQSCLSDSLCRDQTTTSKMQASVVHFRQYYN